MIQCYRENGNDTCQNYRGNGNGTVAAQYDMDITVMLSDIATTGLPFDIIYPNCTILMCYTVPCLF